MMTSWSQAEALAACMELEPLIRPLGMHIGMTGGCLYSEGERKDMDIILYRHHGAELCTFDQFLEAMSAHGVNLKKIHHNVVKMCNERGQWIDFLLRAGVAWPETEACPEGSSDTPRKEKDPDLARHEAIEDRRLDEIFGSVEHDGL